MYEEKKSLLLEMIAFQQLMVILHKKRIWILFIAESIEHRKGILMTLFHQELPKLL
jgi:hypothetical protein